MIARIVIARIASRRPRAVPSRWAGSLAGTPMMDGAIVMAGQVFRGTIDVTPLVTTVVVHGEADLAARSTLDDFLGQALASTAPRINVDLAAVTYLESACLRSLLNAHSAAAEQNRRLRVIYASGVVLRVFEVAGVAEILLADPTDGD